MTAAATTSDLYMQDEAGNQVPMNAPPPMAPAPVPPPTQPVKVTEPVVVKTRMKDEGPDGKIRDTSSEALRPGNELGFRNIDEEQKPPTPAEEPKPEIKEAQAPPPPVPEKIYAGKFKSVEELEKGYQEAQKAMQRAFEEKANLERQQMAKAAEPPKAPVQPSPEQQAAKQARAQQVLNEFVNDPDGWVQQRNQEAIQRTLTALQAQEVTNRWKAANPDLVEHEYFVAAEGSRLMQTNPELAKDPEALFNQATANFRQITGKIRTEGMREALTQETRVIPLSPTAPTQSVTEQPGKPAPMSGDEAYNLTMRMLKEQEQRSHRGLRR